MMRFRRTVKGILAVGFALCCSHQLSSGAAHQKVGKCYLKLKNENKTLGRTRGRRRDRFILVPLSPSETVRLSWKRVCGVNLVEISW